MTFTLAQLADILEAPYKGASDIVIHGLSSLEDAKPGHLSFLSKPLYRKYLAKTKASAVILSEADAQDCSVAMIISPNPYFAYAKLSFLFDTTVTPSSGIASSAVIAANANIHPSASIGANAVIEENVDIAENVIIGPGSIIGKNACIGKNTRLWGNVTLYHDVVIGQNCVIHSGSVIGSDGFGFAPEKGVWHKIAQLGKVIIGDDVEIGANTTIDRGAINDTIIEQGVKIDNQVQIAHNVQIGAHTVIAGKVGIAGSTKIGKHCLIGGGTGIAGHIEIADNVMFTGMSMVTGSINEPGVYSSGTGIQKNSIWLRNAVRFNNLDDIATKIKSLEKRVQEIEKHSKDRHE